MSDFHRDEFEKYNRLSNRAATLAGKVEGWLTMHAEGSASAERALAGIRDALAEYDAARAGEAGA